jgi:hypothetical protein
VIHDFGESVDTRGNGNRSVLVDTGDLDDFVPRETVETLGNLRNLIAG